MLNVDVIDLYQRVSKNARVIVIKVSGVFTPATKTKSRHFPFRPYVARWNDRITISRTAAFQPSRSKAAIPLSANSGHSVVHEPCSAGR
jgi:hypothetical protein